MGTYPVPLVLLFCNSDHDDEVASLESSSGNCGARSSQRLPVKEWKSSPRGSPKLKRKSKKDDGWVIAVMVNIFCYFTSMSNGLSAFSLFRDASHASQSRQPEHHNHQHQVRDHG